MWRVSSRMVSVGQMSSLMACTMHQPPALCQATAAPPPQSLGKPASGSLKVPAMTNAQETFGRIAALIEPFNKKQAALTGATSFAGDLEWDSLTVMDFVAAVEDEFDILITMNMQAEIETVGQLVDAVDALVAKAAS